MSTIYMSQLSTLPLMQRDHHHQDQDQISDHHFASFTSLAKDPPILFPFVINNNHNPNPLEHHGQQIYRVHHLRQHKQQPLPLEQQPNHQFNDHMLMGGSDGFLASPSFRPTVESVGGDMIQRPSYDLYPYDAEKREGRSTGRWLPSTQPPAKLRILRKVSNPAEGGCGAGRKPRRRAQTCEAQHQQQPMGVIRVCSDCNTTKTPLWRSGPCGPKSLCNACGIRQRKARRAMAAASTGGAALATASSDAAQTKAPRKEKRADVDRSLPFKKRCKNMVDHSTAGKASVADVVAAPKSDLVGAAFSHGFPRNEITDAAMLLMTLSCGLVRS